MTNGTIIHLRPKIDRQQVTTTSEQQTPYLGKARVELMYMKGTLNFKSLNNSKQNRIW